MAYALARVGLPVLLALAACDAPTSRQHAALGPAHVLYLDLDGAQVTSAAIDDATMERSQLASASAYPAFVPSVPAPGVSATSTTAVLIDRVRGYFLPFDLTVVTQRPSSGDYAAVLVGGTPASLTPPQTNGIAGVSPVDCDDGNPRSLGFAFADAFTPQRGGVVSLAAAIAHEAGHGFGLQHVQEPLDPMYSVPQPQLTLDDLFQLSFRSGAYSSYVAGSAALQPERCGHPDPLDDHASLVTALGPRQAPLSSPPMVSIVAPADEPNQPASLPVVVSASDDVAVTRVEVYRDLELVAVLEHAPYETTLALLPAPFVTLTVEAVDADGQRARAVRHFAVGDEGPADLTSALADAGTDAAGDAGTVTMDDSGCALAGHGTSGLASVLLLVALATLGRWRRARSAQRSKQCRSVWADR